MIRFLLTATAALAFVNSASAAVVLSDNFDSENGGLSQLNYAGFANFTVTNAVDLVRSGDFGIACVGGAGSCVDLNGSPGRGNLTTDPFAFEIGDVVTFSVVVSGNQRNTGINNQFRIGFDFQQLTNALNRTTTVGDSTFSGGADLIGFGGYAYVPNFDGTEPFTLYALSFTAGSAGTLRGEFGVTADGSVGPVADDVTLSIGPPVIRTPAPAALALFGLGVAALGVARRR